MTVTHQTKHGPAVYNYSTIGNQNISSYMAKWQQDKRRRERLKIGLTRYIHANEVPNTIASQVVEMRNNGATWTSIARKFDFTVYLTQNVFNLHSASLN